MSVIFNQTTGGITLDSGSNATNTGGDELESGTITIKSTPTSSASPLGAGGGAVQFGTGSSSTNALTFDNGGTYGGTNYNIGNTTLSANDTTTFAFNSSAGVTWASTISGGVLLSSSRTPAVIITAPWL